MCVWREEGVQEMPVGRGEETTPPFYFLVPISFSCVGVWGCRECRGIPISF